MKKLKYILFLVFFWGGHSLYTQNYDWVIFEGGTNDEFVTDVDKDQQKNIIAVGIYGPGNANIGGVVLTPTINGPGYKSFIVKYDQNQNMLWAIDPVVSAAGIGISNAGFRIDRVTTDLSNNIFVAGYFRGDITLVGGISMISYSYQGSDYFIAKFDANGVCLWAKNGGSTSHLGALNEGNDIEIDANQNVYLQGVYQGATCNIEGNIVSSNSNSLDYFILSYTNNGTYRWLQTFGTPNNDFMGAFDVDINNNIYFAGSFNWFDVVINGVSYPSGNNQNKLMLVIKLDNLGNFIWVNKTITGNTIANDVTDIVVNSSGVTYTSAIYPLAASPLFSNGTSPLPVLASGTNPFILKLDPNGNFAQAHSFGTTIAGLGNPTLSIPYLDFDDCGENLYLFGHMTGTAGTVAHFDSDSIVIKNTFVASNVGSMYYIVKYDPNLNSQWAITEDSLVGLYRSANFYVEGGNKVVFAGYIGNSTTASEIFFEQTGYSTNGTNSNMVIAQLNLNSYVDSLMADPDTICTPQVVKVWVDSAFVLSGSQLVWRIDTCCFNPIYAYGDTIHPYIDTTTHFYVRVEGPCDTSDYKMITVFFLDSAVQNISHFDTICPGSILVLDASLPNSTYVWTTTETTPQITVDSAAVYLVTVSFLSCQKTDTFHVAYFNSPAPLKVDTIICPNSPITLDATTLGAASYHWKNGALTPTIQVSNAGFYWCDVMINGCIVRDSFTVSEFLIPQGVVVNADLCPDQLLLLYATPPPPATYSWQNGSTLQYYTVSLGGIYWVDVTINGCVKRDTFLVSLKPLPNGVLIDTTLCIGANINLTASDQTAPAYQWNTGQNAISIQVQDSGIYVVSYQLSGCQITDSFLVDYTIKPKGLVNKVLCGAHSLTLTANSLATQYVWNTGDLAQSIQVNIAGTYWVDVSLQNCTVRDSFLVTQTNIINSLFDTIICQNQRVTLTASLPNAVHAWNDQSSANTYEANSAGIYWVDNLLLGCYARDSFIVRNDAVLGAFLKDTTLCDDQKLLLDLSPHHLSNVVWQNQIASETYTITQPGTYFVNYSSACGINSDTIQVLYKNCKCEVFMPNTFTANKDGINDGFGVVTFCRFETFKLEIFNRWGKVLYIANEADKPWDGMFLNKPCKQDVYCWKLTYSYNKLSDIDEIVRYGKVILLDPKRE